MIALYRYARKQRQKHQQKASDPSLAGENSDSEPVQLSQTQPPERKGQWKWRLMLGVSLVIPVFLETLDQTVVATAAPQIASYFRHLDLQSYIGTVYLLTGAVFLLPFASIADVYGRHSALQLALLFFLLGSVLSTAAQNMAMMIAGRGVAGIGAAGLLAVVRIIMSDSSSLDENSWQSGMLFILYAIGFSVGPTIGGFLVEVSFRWIFFINIPSCILAMVIAALILRGKVKEGRTPETTTGMMEFVGDSWYKKLLYIDWTGSAIFVAGGILLLLALNWGSTTKWASVQVIVCFVVGGLLLGACFGWEWVLMKKRSNGSNKLLWAPFPLIPVDILRSFDICVVQLASFVNGMVMLCMFYFIAIFATIVLNLPPGQSGVQLLYFAPGLGVGSLISMQMVRFFRQPKFPVIFGSFLMPITLGFLSYGARTGNNDLVRGFLVATGVATGAPGSALPIQARFALPPERLAVVSSLSLFSRALGGTFGIAQLATILQAKSRALISNAVAAGQFSPGDLAILSRLSGQFESVDSIGQLSAGGQAIVRHAYSVGLQFCFISLIPWAGIVCFLVPFLSHIEDGDRVREQPVGDDDKVAPELTAHHDNP